MKYVFIIAAFLSPFLFPYPLTLVLSAVASFFFPPVAFLVGLLAEILYFTPQASLVPIAALGGLLISVLALFVRRFAKARIIGG